ncbi:MAG: hypothetical protein ACI4O0_07940 [Candidatus Limivicinus sp.]
MAELEKNEEVQQERETDRSSVKLVTAPGGSVSRDYSNTMAALKESEFALPEYSSSYDQQITELYNKIVSREPFKYDPMSDSLYGQYREQYTRMGRMAMMDSMGKAAALTGGYGSSYAQKVGQQEYDEYLQKLGEVMPELYGAAYQRYKDQGEALESQYQRLTRLEGQEYDRYRDQVEDAKYQQGMEANKEKAENDRKDKNYDRLVELITKVGYTPSREELEQSGMTQAQAEAYLKRYGGYGGGGSSNSGIPISYYYYNGNKNNNGSAALTKTQQKLTAAGAYD